MTAPAPIRIRDITAGYGRGAILQCITLDLPANRITTIIGPNGCGKSTLLRVVGRHLVPDSGTVDIEGADIRGMKPRVLATRLTVLPQTPVAPEGITVADLVARGRQPHRPWYRQWSSEDEAIIAAEMEATGVSDLADHELASLSGGQRQRAWIAMALAQRTPILLLDEPTTHLDLAHAIEVLELVVRLRAERDRTIVMVLHDLSLAARYSDRIVVMDAGRVVAEGAPAETITVDLLHRAFGLRARVFPDPIDAVPTITPVSRG